MDRFELVGSCRFLVKFGGAPIEVPSEAGNYCPATKFGIEALA